MNAFDLSFLQAAGLVAKGARLVMYRTRQAIALGAIEWIEGKGLLIAELGCEHQGQVHLIAATRLERDGPMIDVYDAEGLVGTIDTFDDVDLTPWRERLATEAWRIFWQSEIAEYRQS